MKRFQMGMMAVLLFWMTAVQADEIPVGVYVHLATVENGDLDAICGQLEAAIVASDFQMIGSWELDTPHPHGYRAKVFVMTDSALTGAASAVEARRFLAVPLRLAVYEGAGKSTIHINMANPVAAAMVYFHEAEGYAGLVQAARDVKDRMVALAGGALAMEIVAEEMEPLRPESALNGYNGDGPAKVMAMFKDFASSLKAVAKEKIDGDAQLAFDNACTAFEANTAKSGEGWVIVGSVQGHQRKLYCISRPETEELAMRIVGIARDSEADPAPGIDHAAAFPIEVLIYEEDGKILTATLGEMWRMQFYFWDAGYGAFAKHAQVPSQIFGSIKNVINGKK